MNEALEKNKKCKREGREITSTSYSAIKWSYVSEVFKGGSYTQDGVEFPDANFTHLTNYLSMVNHCFKDLNGKEAKRLYYISPIIVAVCSAFNGEVSISVEEDIVGKRVQANGRFEMVLQRGNKRVCIVEAKRDDMEQGMSQCLVGCEVAADLDNLDVVYGIVTNYEAWRLTRSGNENIRTEEITLTLHNRVPNEASLRELCGKIYGMLKAEN